MPSGCAKRFNWLHRPRQFGDHANGPMTCNSQFDSGFAALFAEMFHFSDCLLRILRGFAATFCVLYLAAKPPLEKCDTDR